MQSFSEPLANGVSSHLDALALQLLEILKKEHVCQCEQEDMEDISQEDDDQAEQDALVINAAADTISALSTVMGPSFSVYFRKFFPLVAKYYKPSRPEVDRNMAIGAIAEAAAGLGSGVTEFTNDLVQLFVKGLRDAEEEVKSNAAYGIGILCQNSATDLTRYDPNHLHTYITVIICSFCNSCILSLNAAKRRLTSRTMHVERSPA